MWNQNECRLAKAIFKKKNKFGALTLLHFQTFYKTIVIKTVKYWQIKSLRMYSMFYMYMYVYIYT
jgi:hypothetical protein